MVCEQASATAFSRAKSKIKHEANSMTRPKPTPRAGTEVARRIKYQLLKHTVNTLYDYSNITLLAVLCLLERFMLLIISSFGSEGVKSYLPETNFTSIFSHGHLQRRQ